MIKQCSCRETPYKHIKGRHHARYCPMYRRNGTGWSQNIDATIPLWPLGPEIPQPYFILHLKQFGVALVRLDFRAQKAADGSICGYKADIGPCRTKWYDRGVFAIQQRKIIAEATAWIAIDAEQELQAYGWIQRDIGDKICFVPPEAV